MTTGSAGLRGVRIAAAALLVLTVAAAGCGRPDDEAWLRCLGFTQLDKTISVLEGDLNDGTSSTVDIKLENSSLIVGQKVGTGMLVNRTRIDYRMTGFSPPSAEAPVNLYLPPPAESKPTTGTLTAFPLASKSLKQWLTDAGVRDPVVQLNAHVTFYGVTDEGTQIETEASLRVALTNAGGTAPATLPVVTVSLQSDAIKEGADGGFIVSRSGSTAASISVAFTTTGSASETNDYQPIGNSVLIPAGSTSNTITVIARPTATAGRSLIITLTKNASYEVGTPSSTTLKIIETKPTLTVVLKKDASKTTGSGAFTVYRSGYLSPALTVLHLIGGTAGASTYSIGTPVVILANHNSVEIQVTALASAVVDATVIFSLKVDASYTVGSPSSATLKIVP